MLITRATIFLTIFFGMSLASFAQDEAPADPDPGFGLNGTANEKPQIPDEPSPFIDTFPKPPPPKPEKAKAGARAAGPGAKSAKPAEKKNTDPFSSAKAETVMRVTPRPEPKIAVATPEPTDSGPPAQPDAAKLKEADELLKKAKVMWDLDEFESSVKLAEKARKVRVSQLGEDHAKVAEVDVMIKAAREKITLP